MFAVSIYDSTRECGVSDEISVVQTLTNVRPGARKMSSMQAAKLVKEVFKTMPEIMSIGRN